MLSATELTKRCILLFWVTRGFLEVQDRILTETDLTISGVFWVTRFFQKKVLFGRGQGRGQGRHGLKIIADMYLKYIYNIQDI